MNHQNTNKRIEMHLNAPQAKSAAVAGTFNDWNPSKTPMRRAGNGDWVAKISVPPGRHEYRFVVDGQWISDPRARQSVPNPYGGENSVIAL